MEISEVLSKDNSRSSKLRHVNKQWSSHEGTVENCPTTIDIVHSRRHSQSTRSIMSSTTTILQLENFNDPIQNCDDWKSRRDSDFGLVKDDIRQMNHYRHVRLVEQDDLSHQLNPIYGDPDINYYKNDHRFQSAYNQRLVARHSRQAPKEQNPNIGDKLNRFSPHRSSAYQNKTNSNLTVTDFVNQRYRSHNAPDSSQLIKQSSWESPSKIDQLEVMNTKGSRNLQIDQVKRQKSCEISTYFDTPSTFRPLQEPYSRSHRDSISSLRKQSFQSAYGNAEVTIGIENLSLESSNMPDYEDSSKDFLSVHRYNTHRESLSKQRSCESPPVFNEEFSYAQKYKIANYRQKSCDSPTNMEDTSWNQINHDRMKEKRSSIYLEERFMVKNDKGKNDTVHSRYQSTLISSQSNLVNAHLSSDVKRQSFDKSCRKKNKLDRQPSMDLRDNLNRQSQNQYGIYDEIITKHSDSINNLDYLSPTRYGETYTRTPMTKQLSCEIAISPQYDDHRKPFSNHIVDNDRPSSSNYNYNIHNSFENMKPSDRTIYGNKNSFYPDPLVSTSSTDLRHMRKSIMTYSKGADNILSSVESNVDAHSKNSKRHSIKASPDGYSKYLDVPATRSKLVKQCTYDTSSTQRGCSSNSSSPSKIKMSMNSPNSDKLSKVIS